MIVDELEDHTLTPAAQHVLGRIQLPARIRGRVDEPPPCRGGLLLRLKTSHVSLTEDACQRRHGRDLFQAHRVHFLVHTDRPVVQARSLQSGTHCHGLFLDLIAQLRRARLWSPGPGFEHRGRPIGLRAPAQLVERLPGDAVLGAERLGAERRDRPGGAPSGHCEIARRTRGSMGSLTATTRTLGQVSPPRQPELSPMS